MRSFIKLISVLQVVGIAIARDYVTVPDGPTFAVNYNATAQVFRFNAWVT